MWVVMLRVSTTVLQVYCKCTVLYYRCTVLYCTAGVLYCTTGLLYHTAGVLYFRCTVPYCRCTVLYYRSTVPYCRCTVLYCTTGVLYSTVLQVYCTVLYCVLYWMVCWGGAHPAVPPPIHPLGLLHQPRDQRHHTHHRWGEEVIKLRWTFQYYAGANSRIVKNCVISRYESGKGAWVCWWWRTPSPGDGRG